jgi:hypothetical protein
MTKSPIVNSFDAGCLCSRSGRGQQGEKEETLRTKETKIAGMDDSFCVCIARPIIEGRELTTDISDAKYSAMDSVY